MFHFRLITGVIEINWIVYYDDFMCALHVFEHVTFTYEHHRTRFLME